MANQRRSWLEQKFANWNASLGAYLNRRPHRSFRRTRRRDYVRSFKLPGLIGLTREAVVLIGRNWRLFGLFFLLYAVASAIILGVINQTNYSSLVSQLKTSDISVWLRTFAIFGAAITGSVDTASTTNAQVVAGLELILGWLILVWLLRHLVAGTKVKLREGMYNAGAPLIPTVLVLLVGLLQCVPLVLVALGWTAAANTGLLSHGVEAMVFYAALLVLTLISLYWLVSTFIALIIVTLPGMYPMAALRAAGDMVIGRRFRLILRLLWMLIVILVLWAVVLIPIILLDNALNLAWLPLVPLFVLALETASLVFACTYIYLLYRKLVDDEAKPATR